MEQTTEQDENTGNENPQQISEDDQYTQKTQNVANKPPDGDIRKTTERSQTTPLQEESINTRGEKYILRPNPTQNYSDSYRYYLKNAEKSSYPFPRYAIQRINLSSFFF